MDAAIKGWEQEWPCLLSLPLAHLEFVLPVPTTLGSEGLNLK